MLSWVEHRKSFMTSGPGPCTFCPFSDRLGIIMSRYLLFCAWFGLTSFLCKAQPPDTSGVGSVWTMNDAVSIRTDALDIPKSEFISSFWYLKVNFLVPEKLLWDTSSLRLRGWNANRKKGNVRKLYSVLNKAQGSHSVGRAYLRPSKPSKAVWQAWPSYEF